MDPAALFHFSKELLYALGCSPTSTRLAILTEWARCENTGARFNPLATTQPGGEDQADPYWNSFGPGGSFHVRNYQDEHSGVLATAATLNSGRYNNVLRSLVDGWMYPEAAPELRTWGTTPFADEVAAGWQPQRPDVPVDFLPHPANPMPPELAAKLPGVVAALRELADTVAELLSQPPSA